MPRKKTNPAKVAGPGRFAKRTDLPKTPGIGRVGDPEGLAYGDVSRLESAQGAAPPAGGGGRPPLDTSRRPQGAPTSNDQLPDFLTSPETAVPGEPDTTGLPSGPGAGPEALMAQQPPDDMRVLTLQFLANVLGNQEAAKLLEGMAPPAPVSPVPGPPVLPQTQETQPEAPVG